MIGHWIAGGSAVVGAALAAAAAISRRWTRPLDRRPALAAAAVALIAFGVSAGFSLLRQPYPSFHDEFSHLLAADTFAHGRLSNPSPPLPEHFESFHVITTPTYASKYPPGQGLSLALGQVLFRSPIAGAWLAFAAACAAVYWALRATLPARFALAGALLAAIFPPFHDMGLHAWTQTYWGGQVPLLGGALLFGSAARLARRARPLYGLTLGAGMAVLAFSRPFEGFLAASLALLGIARSLRSGSGPSPALLARRVAPCAAAVLAAAIGWQLFYNFRVTGHALTTPYLAYESRYATVPFALWLPAPPPKQYANRDMRTSYDAEGKEWRARRSWRAAGGLVWSRLKELATYFAKPVLWLWIALPLALMRRRARRITGVLAAGTGVSLTMSWLHPHYLAPFVPLGIELAARSLRALARLEGRWRIGGAALILITLSSVSYRLVDDVAGRRPVDPGFWPALRTTLTRHIAGAGGRFLVIVERREGWTTHRELVYNRAVLEEQPVVWARSLDPGRDRELVERFPDRTPLRLVLDRAGWAIEPWPPADSPPR